MDIYIDFNSDETLYKQLCNQIILSIAKEDIKEGDSLPTVRQLADDIGINMHTVNKAYLILKNDGYISLDRRRGAVVCIAKNKQAMINDIKKDLYSILARSICNGLTREELRDIIDEVYTDFNRE